MPISAPQAVFDYHERTKHHLNRYARSPGYLDWSNQPNAFRVYDDTRRTPLPLPIKDPQHPHPALYTRSTHRARQFCRETVSTLLGLSMGLSAWKSSSGSRWALRMNPSSGNLHPTEAYLVVPPMSDLPSGVHHYSPFYHALETRLTPSEGAWAAFHSHFKGEGILLALTSIFWRESWKYGERALRYCYLDAGHALAAVSIAAGLLGWRARLLEGASAGDLRRLLGLDRTAFPEGESEYPDLVCQIRPGDSSDSPQTLSEAFLHAVDQTDVTGTPKPLSDQHVNWKVIPATADVIEAMPVALDAHPMAKGRVRCRKPAAMTAAEIIRSRRSATAFNPSIEMERDRFLDIIEKVLPIHGSPPFDAGAARTRVHLLLFVHQVAGMAPGLYCLCRAPDDLAKLKSALHPDFEWRAVNDGLPLFCLMEDDVRADAIQASCHQEIAGLSAFSVGMLAWFQEPVASNPAVYRHLFRECGMIGQVLYLEAEAQGARGTGIGCFFDDVVHELAGLRDKRLQSLYHFTVGAPITDHRIATLAPSR